MFFSLTLLVFVLAQTYMLAHIFRVLPKWRWRAAVALWCFAMVGVWWMRHNNETGNFVSLYMTAGFVWLGFSLFATGMLALTDVLRLFRLAARRREDSRPERLSASKRVVPLALAVAALLSMFAIWEAYSVRPYYFTLASKKIPKGSKPFRIAVVSDMHIGRFIGPRFLRQTADIVTAAEPDLFLSLGDLIDAELERGSEEAATLRSIKARLGSYGVTGNHEFYHNIDSALAFHKDAGITVLRGAGREVGPICLAGADDAEGGKRGLTSARRAKALHACAKSDKFVLFMYHVPQVSFRDIGRFDLQLSGHTHGGQIWPGSLFIKLVHKYSAERFAPLTGKNSASGNIFVTYGTGFMGPPMRFFAPPEVLILDLVPAP